MARPVRAEGTEEVQSLPNLDALGEGGLLELGADLPAQFGSFAGRIESEDRDPSPIERTEALKTLDSGGLACAVGSEDAEDLTRLHFE